MSAILNLDFKKVPSRKNKYQFQLVCHALMSEKRHLICTSSSSVTGDVAFL